MNHLSPSAVFRFFETICSIPHGSGNVAPLADWCARFCTERNLKYRRDEADNIVIWKEASSGYEDAAPLILQGHLDMVCAKTADAKSNPQTDGVTPVVDGEWIRTDGTTLGGDNGIAVAMFLAILDDDTLAHPPLEVVLTADEEIGLIGAQALDMSQLFGRRMINLDSEEEGEFTVSCAGGVRAECVLPVTRCETTGVACQLTVSELSGGHSGVEIHKGRANAHILMARLLYAICRQADIQLLSLAGGEVDNAIASRSTATLLIPSSQTDKISEIVEQYRTAFRTEYALTDPSLTVKWQVGEQTTADTVSATDTDRIISVLRNVPNGVQAMSPAIPDLVQTSLNLGILHSDDTSFSAVFSVRSSLESQKDMLKEALYCLFERNGGSVTFSGEYPGWAYRQQSPLRESALAAYRDLFGSEATVSAIHAGLECGIFADALPGLDCISFGPDMRDVHTPQERLSIASVARTYQLLLEILKRS